MARTIVQAVVAADPGAAVLHRWEDIEGGRTESDVDIVSTRSALETLNRLDFPLDDGIRPVMLWPYDTGGTASIFFFDTAASEGAQIDILHDPMGLGHYGLSSSSMHLRSEVFPPRLSSSDHLIYLWSKRFIKGHNDEAGRLFEEIKATPDALVAANRIVRSPRLRRLLGVPIARRTIWVYWTRQVFARLIRSGMRLMNPVGFWAHSLSDEATVSDVASRFNRVLVATQVIPWKSGILGTFGGLSKIASLRWRAGLAISFGPQPLRGALMPDLVINQASADELASTIVMAMSRRISPARS